jgi:hypothetical protein
MIYIFIFNEFPLIEWFYLCQILFVNFNQIKYVETKFCFFQFPATFDFFVDLPDIHVPKQPSTKHTHKTKDRVTQTPGVNLGAPEG